MRDHDEGHPPPLLNPDKDLHDSCRVYAVQVSGGLIGQQYLRIIRQRSRDRDTLPLSGRELVGILACPFFRSISPSSSSARAARSALLRCNDSIGTCTFSIARRVGIR